MRSKPLFFMIKRNPHRIIAILLGWVLAVTWLTACQAPGELATPPTSGVTYEIAPVFREFHASLGGAELMGPAISQLFPYEELECQYTLNALMCQNPLVSGTERFKLYPLGKAFKLKPVEADVNVTANAHVIDGIVIFEDFVPIFDQLSGEQFAGKPISGVNINYKQQRIEQYFENLGFYRPMNDSEADARLLAYGAYACDQLCSYPPHIESMISDPSETIIEQPFKTQLEEMGVGSAFGIPLTQPYIAEDGALEQVFTAVVIFNPAEKPGKILLRPITTQLGITEEKPVKQTHKQDDSIVFYPVKDGKGHHVPARVDRYINNHGGRKLAGVPISESIEVETGLFRQCFTNYCVLYQPGAEKGEQVRLVALGQQYLDLIQSSIARVNPSELSTDTVSITLNEKHEKLPLKTEQQIEVLLLMKKDQSPLSGVETTLDVRLPDGTHYTSGINATDETGRAGVIVPVMKKIRNGDLIVYSVCLVTGSSTPLCAEGSYLAWNTP